MDGGRAEGFDFETSLSDGGSSLSKDDSKDDSDDGFDVSPTRVTWLFLERSLQDEGHATSVKLGKPWSGDQKMRKLEDIRTISLFSLKSLLLEEQGFASW